MADDLGAPLGRKRSTEPAPGRRAPLSPSRLPLARLAFGVVALLALGIASRFVFVDDPDGGRPVAEIDITGTRNDIAETVSTPVTITAEPETPAGGPDVIVVGDDVPAGSPLAVGPDAANADGLVPALLEDTEFGAIPRIAPTGETPFETYARPALTPATAGGKKLIAVVVTGLGLNAAGTRNAIDTLPDAVTLAFAPYGTGVTRAVATAREGGHEILLEVPLEPFDYPESDPGPDTLLTGRAPRDNLQKLFAVMARFGGYVGLVNHMGARFTASAADLAPVMEELATRGLGYLDDGSSNRSLAAQLAGSNGVVFARANLLLDENPARAPILAQLRALEAEATKTGAAIGILSALPVSVQTLAEWAGGLDDASFELVPVSALMRKGP
jgi:polysaccharide deacetylase 2 family uncharacterized protein YibQ